MSSLEEIIAEIEAKRRSDFPWTREEPFDQPFYTYLDEKKSWHETSPSGAFSTAVTTNPTVTVLSWNIDFMTPYPNERLTGALKFLFEHHVANATPPPIILLQEIVESDLDLLQGTPWIQTSYRLTDVNRGFWESGHYGTVTLVPKELRLTRVFRVHYSKTRMERDALFVDVDVGLGEGQVLRVCNTHLESLVADPPLRPSQLATAARWMKAEGVAGAVLGGDLNAIEPFDRTLHSENGLDDAYLSLGGQEDSDGGYTWGQMATPWLRQRFGCSRMDKLLFSGAAKATSFENFGLGVEVEDENIRGELAKRAGLEAGWVTDHLGVKGYFNIGQEP